MIDDAFLLLLSLSFVIQVTVDLVKSWMQNLALPEGFHRYTALVVSLIAGILLAYETNVGLLAAMGVPVKHPPVDSVLTGLVLAGGSNVIYQIVEYLRANRGAQ